MKIEEERKTLGELTDKETVTEIERFMNELANWERSAKTINSRFKFDPFLFLLWRISNK